MGSVWGKYAAIRYIYNINAKIINTVAALYTHGRRRGRKKYAHTAAAVRPAAGSKSGCMAKLCANCPCASSTPARVTPQAGQGNPTVICNGQIAPKTNCANKKYNNKPAAGSTTAQMLLPLAKPCARGSFFIARSFHYMSRLCRCHSSRRSWCRRIRRASCEATAGTLPVGRGYCPRPSIA